MNRSLFVATLALIVLGNNPTQAVNLLSSGDFEPSTGPVPGWSLLEFATGSGTTVDAAEAVTNFTPHTAPFDLWLKSFIGGQDPNGPNLLSNAILSQTVLASAGETYTFSGYSRWEPSYSGGAGTLDPNSPLGAVASPTTNTMELAFLDPNGVVLGSPVTLDLLADGQSNINLWKKHTLAGLAPAGTVSARVTADGKDMVFNVDFPSQSAFYDTFSVTGAGSPLTELLTNPDLDIASSDGLENWTITTDDPENPANDEIIRSESFANHTPGGSLGVWLSSFFGEPATPVDGKVSQTVPGVAGGEYTLTGYSLFEEFFSGGDPNSPTQTFMEVAFLDPNNVVIGAPTTLDLFADGQTNNGGWLQHTLNATAPTGTASVRVSSGMIDGISIGGAQSAFLDDFVLELATGLDGDFNGDGVVDGKDFLKWQRDDGSAAGLALWEANYGATSLVAAVGAVPEPMTAAMLLMGTVVASLGGARRRRSA